MTNLQFYLYDNYTNIHLWQKCSLANYKNTCDKFTYRAVTKNTHWPMTKSLQQNRPSSVSIISGASGKHAENIAHWPKSIFLEKDLKFNIVTMLDYGLGYAT